MRKNDIEDFWLNVCIKSKNKCWIWTACKNEKNYGYFRFLSKQRKAHRVSFFLTHNRWPKFHCLHSCDNPSCVNPNHLFEGNDLSNMQDRDKKGRHGNSKLSYYKIQRIRNLRKKGLTHKEIGLKMNICRTAITKVLRRNTYKHIKFGTLTPTAQANL